MSENSISRRQILKFGAASAAGAAILRPTSAQAQETGTVEATIRRGAVPFLMGDTASQMSIFPYGQFEGGMVKMANIPSGSRGLMNRLNLVSAGANYGVRADWVPAGGIDISDAETIEFWAYLASPSVWANGDPTSGAPGFLTFGTADLRHMFSAFFSLKPGWNHVRIGKSQFFVSEGSPSWTQTFDLMRVAMQPCAAGPISAFFGEFRKNGKDRPLVCLIFDDGEDSVRANALPILNANNIPATIAVISNNLGKTLGTRKFSSMSQLKSYPSSTAFVNHTASHMRGVLDQPTTPYLTIANEISQCQSAMSTLHGFDPTMFCAPYGEWSDLYLSALKNLGVVCSRTIVSGGGPGYQRYTGSRIDNPLLLGAWSVTKDQTAAQILQYVDTGIASGQSMIIVFHDVRPNAVAAIDYPVDRFSTVVQGLRARRSQADFVTMPTLYRRLSLNGMI